LESAEVVLQDGRLRVIVKANGEASRDEMDLNEEATMLHWPSGEDEKDG
jgi:hypothetical protein